MTETFERPEIIDAKTYETSLSIEKGMFRRRQIPAVVEARQLQSDKYAARKWAILGIISRISIGEVIRYDLTLQRGGDHKDLRTPQYNERICRADGTSIVDIITRGWNCGKSSPVVYAWYDKGNIEEQIRHTTQMIPKVLLVGCYALRELIQTIQTTDKLPNSLMLTNDDIEQSKGLERSGIHIESVPTKKFAQLVKSVYL